MGTECKIWQGGCIYTEGMGLNTDAKIELVRNQEQSYDIVDGAGPYRWVISDKQNIAISCC
jgi:hypothetical protein